ncbi:hypothetical protein, variant [Verruconis gallopava]|uniref:GPI mannosyltransferase 1 n=1 Tax=Verruconis gallopava TaxID=253628 RepID=A0A0D2ALF8_9PEZI|nr:hypothetical protein, variant [Verruconis gallopava]KIW07350.1 hypothetical protein, variant [Verruconis gallopava]
MGLVSLFSSPTFVFGGAVVLRVFLLFWGLYQDATSAFKYTDIDYFVFTDAARFVSQRRSPYDRDTYRYTPLLAWILVPTAWSRAWFSFGKVLFALADIVAGYLIVVILRSSYRMPRGKALGFASIWLLNPMVATISTRGSSEGLLGVLAVALVWAVTQRRIVLAGFILGFSVHFKIYPFIYAASILWWLDDERRNVASTKGAHRKPTQKSVIQQVLNKDRVLFSCSSLFTFVILNVWMYSIYGWPFLEHGYLYHLTRVDHRHNFSPYNTMLYLNSSPAAQSSLRLESLAFLPQLMTSAVLIPLALAKKDLASTMLAQTFAFVTFNKVCTSQAFWLFQGYQLEFLGNSTFVPGLWFASIAFFLVNCAILSVIISDVALMNDAAKQKKAQ